MGNSRFPISNEITNMIGFLISDVSLGTHKTAIPSVYFKGQNSTKNHSLSTVNVFNFLLVGFLSVLLWCIRSVLKYINQSFILKACYFCSDLLSCFLTYILVCLFIMKSSLIFLLFPLLFFKGSPLIPLFWPIKIFM